MHPYLLHHFLERTSETHPEQAAVVIKNDSISYKELNKRSNQLAAALKELGVAKCDRVGFVLNKSIDAVVGIFAILKAGAIYVPIDPLAPSERVRYIVGNCSIEVLLTSQKNLPKITDCFGRDFSLRKIILTDAKDEHFAAEYPGSDFFSFAELLPNQVDTNPCINISDTNLSLIHI